MQDELDAARPDAVQILIVNEIGYDSGLPDLYEVTDLPVLQDDATAQVWTNWGATWRDVYVVDQDNELVTVYNLTTYDLRVAENYAALYELLLTAADGG